MKKRLLWIGLFLLIAPVVLLALQYFLTLSRQPPVRRNELATLVPPAPLAYVECARLQTRLGQLVNRPEYPVFLQSDFMKQVRQTEWWRDFSAAFKAFWNSLIIDPLRIIGADVALAIYPAETDAALPGVLLIGKIDRTAQIAERILYLVDRVQHQVGITLTHEEQGFPIYRIAQPDMLCPLYYAIAGNLGVIATSLPLVQATLRAAVAATPPPVQSAAFRQIFGELPEKRVVTGYLNLAGVSAEFRQNAWLQSLELPLATVWGQGGNLPFVTIGLETDADRLTLRTELYAAADAVTRPAPRSSRSLSQGERPARLPIMAAFDQKELTPFLQNWQRVWPQWEWALPVQQLAQTQALFGGRIECQVGNTLAGAVYRLPELACLIETQRPEPARALLDATVQAVIDQRVPAIAQQTLVKRATETYRNTPIAKVSFMFQEMLNYAVAENGRPPSSTAYTVLATTSREVKEQLDALPTHSAARPVWALALPDQALFTGVVNNPELAELMQQFSQTNTFAVLYPRQVHPQFYERLPLLIQLLQAFPVILLEGGAQGAGLYFEISLPGKE